MLKSKLFWLLVIVVAIGNHYFYKQGKCDDFGYEAGMEVKYSLCEGCSAKLWDSGEWIDVDKTNAKVVMNRMIIYEN